MVTFNLQLGGVPDLGSRIASHTGEVSGMSRVKTRNAEKARIRVKSRHVHAKIGRKWLTVLEPGDH